MKTKQAVSLVFGALITFAMVPRVLAIENGAAEGTVTVNGKAVTLKFAYAVAAKGFSDETKDDTVVILSDVPLAPAVLRDKPARRDLEKAGRLHAIEATINAEKQPINVTVRDAAFKMPASGGSTEDLFEAKTFEKGMIAGRLHRKSPGSSFDDISFTYDVRFKAAVLPRKE